MSYVARLRIYTPLPLATDQLVTLEGNDHHYLRNVVRRLPGDTLYLFNAESGEYLAEIVELNKKATQCVVKDQHKLAPAALPAFSCHLAFALVKQTALHLIIEKATELGVHHLHPLITDHSVVSRVNEEKLMHYTKEAAEQCERLDLPTIHPLMHLTDWLDNIVPPMAIFYGDETGQGLSLPKALTDTTTTSACLLIGPEGGFSDKEHQLIRHHSSAKAISLGPRILKAETAAIAGLTCLMAHLGDW